ncbi:MAG: ABC transporter substrate-binding protein [Ruminococcaceae bacterium]|nr:ABC transporter substrate-binding protein [Oscillospiraceae bacterium]
MKKTLSLIFTALFIVLAFAGCGSTADDSKTITVGASVTPHAEILNAVSEALKAEGYTLKVVEYNDYVIPNTATEDGTLDANYFQHQPYLDTFNAEKGTHLVSVAAIHYEPFGLYAGKLKSLDEIKEGSVISVPNDGSNEARALKLLESLGYIKLNAEAGFNATVLDIVENKLNLEIKEIEAAQLVRSLEDVDYAIINGNYAIQGGLTVKDALATEDAKSDAAQTYANVIVVKEGNENSEKVQALIKALKTETVRKFIDEKYAGSVVAIF